MQDIYQLWPKQYFAMRMLGLVPDDPVETPVEELFYGGQVGGGKAVSLETPIPTLMGWLTMSDIKVGDYIFSEDGSPTRVIALSEIDTTSPS